MTEIIDEIKELEALEECPLSEQEILDYALEGGLMPDKVERAKIKLARAYQRVKQYERYVVGADAAASAASAAGIKLTDVARAIREYKDALGEFLALEEGTTSGLDSLVA